VDQLAALQDIAIVGTRADKREIIVDAAWELFLQQGYEATTIAQVAAKAGVAVGSVYRYVEDKRDLLEVVRTRFAERVATAMRAALDGPGGEDGRVSAMVDAVFAVARENPAAVQFLFLAPHHLGNGARHVLDPMAEVIESWLASDVANGRVSTAAARIASALAVGMMLAAVAGGQMQDDRPGDAPGHAEVLKQALRHWRQAYR
jgi:AcrR family transcriptional regulator